jgi:NADH:ubiquinone oxidoreductase subunit E
MNGSQPVIDKFKEELKIAPGQTTRNGSFSFDIVTCMGGCFHGPVIMINGEYQIHVRPEQVSDLIKKLKYIVEND